MCSCFFSEQPPPSSLTNRSPQLAAERRRWVPCRKRRYLTPTRQFPSRVPTQLTSSSRRHVQLVAGRRHWVEHHDAVNNDMWRWLVNPFAGCTPADIVIWISCPPFTEVASPFSGCFNEHTPFAHLDLQRVRARRVDTPCMGIKRIDLFSGIGRCVRYQ